MKLTGPLVAIGLILTTAAHAQPPPAAPAVALAPAQPTPPPLPSAAEDALRDAREETRKAQDAYAAADKRLSDFAAFGSSITAGFGVVAGLFGVLITAVVIFFTVRTSTTARIEAREAATEALARMRTELDQEVKRMTDDALSGREATSLAKAELEAMLAQIRGAKTEADQHVDVIRAAAARLDLGFQPLEGAKAALAPAPAVADQAKQALAKPEPERSFSDWLAVGLAAVGGSREDDANAAYARAADLAPDPSSRRTALSLQADLAWKQKRYAEALFLLDRILGMQSALPAESIARALFNKGIALGALGRGADELATYDDLFARFVNEPAPALRAQVAKALNNKGITLGTLGRYAEALTAHDALLARYIDDPTPALHDQVAKALFNRGVTLGALGRDADELAAYDGLIARFADDPAPGPREQVAKALVNKGNRLGALGRDGEALAAYDDVITRFADDPAPALRELVANALLNKGVRLGKLGRGADELAAYDDLLARFANDPAPALREQVARALLYKGITLGQLGRTADARATYDDLLTRFADDAAPAIQALVARARTLRPSP
jgi:tetratricopeptide (TPR) repeat protein